MKNTFAFQLKTVAQTLMLLKKSYTSKIICDDKISYRLSDASYGVSRVVQCENTKDKITYRFLLRQGDKYLNMNMNQNLVKFLYNTIAKKHEQLTRR